MKSAVVIPTYWSSDERLGTPGSVACYDHATPVESEHPQLASCLSSLERVAGLGTVVILVVAPPEVEERAVARVHEMASERELPEVVIVDSFKAMAAANRIADILPPDMGEPVSLRGYGAIRNMGLVACCALGCDVAVFLDDDEVVLDEDFLVNAVYGFGQVSRQGLPVMAKSGYFLDRRNSALADRRQVKACDKYWAKRAEFNEWMTQALAGPRISHSNTLCGGCFAVHAEAFTRVSFDPWITRGEDLDYLFDLRLYGVDVWFDNKWRVRHTPPRVKDTASRFLQDVYRWTYERRKIEVCNSNIDLQKLLPESLMPYPGPWISPELPARISKTALLRALMTSEHGAYWRVFTRGRKDAVAYAEQNCARYLDFQPYWSEITHALWLDEEFARVLMGPGMLNPDIAARMAQRAGRVGLADPDGSATPAPAAQQASSAVPAAAVAAVSAAGAQQQASGVPEASAPMDPETSAALDALADSYVADIVDNSSQNA